MRLLSTTISHEGNFEIEYFNDEEIPPYAILSHTWGREEVTLQELNSPEAKRKKGYDKIKKCCLKAKSEGLDFVWIDTCCIDKTSSAELSEAINSMYRWYQDSEICYAYLEDVPSEKQFSESRWFTRGWTLQELIAPSKVVFLDELWNEVDDRTNLEQIVSDCTGVPIGILAGTENLGDFSIAQRMSWAAGRKTSRIEDRAYSLLGIFGINMPLIYGEKENAFIRLQEEILRVSNDLSLFAWKHETGNGILARSPAAFIDAGNIIRCFQFNSLSPPTMSSRGIQLEVHFMGVGSHGLGIAVLDCQEQGRDQTSIAIYVRDIFLSMQTFARVSTTELRELDLRSFRQLKFPMRKICVEARRLGNVQKLPPGDRSTVPGYFYPQDILQTWTDTELGFAYGLAVHLAWQGDDHLLWFLMTRSDVEAAIKSPTFFLDCSKNHDFWFPGSDPFDYNITPLSVATEKGHASVVKMLLDRGATAGALEDSEVTLLKLAVRSGRGSIVRLIYQKSMMTNIPFSQLTEILMEAHQQGKESVVNTLSDLCVTMDAAIKDGLVNTVKLLLDRGEAINELDTWGRTPLIQAVTYGNKPIVELLLERGAAMGIKDIAGKTALSWAIERKHESIAELLGKNLELNNE